MCSSDLGEAMRAELLRRVTLAAALDAALAGQEQDVVVVEDFHGSPPFAQTQKRALPGAPVSAFYGPARRAGRSDRNAPAVDMTCLERRVRSRFGDASEPQRNGAGARIDPLAPKSDYPEFLAAATKGGDMFLISRSGTDPYVL